MFQDVLLYDLLQRTYLILIPSKSTQEFPRRNLPVRKKAYCPLTAPGRAIHFFPILSATIRFWRDGAIFVMSSRFIFSCCWAHGWLATVLDVKMSSSQRNRSTWGWVFIEAAIYTRKNITGYGRVVGSTTRDSAVNMIEYRICKITVLFCYVAINFRNRIKICLLWNGMANNFRTIVLKNIC